MAAPLNVLITQPADTSTLHWQLLGPHTPAQQARLAEQISRTTAYAEQHHISLLAAVEALATQDAVDAEDSIHVHIQHAMQTPTCLTGPEAVPDVAARAAA